MSVKNYFTKPDGEGLADKCMYLMKQGALLGATVSLQQGYTLQNKLSLSSLALYARNIYYLSGAGFLFASGTYICTRLRGKDDPYNHFFGTYFAAPLMKSYTKLPLVYFNYWTFVVAVGLLLNKLRRETPSGLESPFDLFYEMDLAIRDTHMDYWTYNTGLEAPLDDYVN